MCEGCPSAAPFAAPAAVEGEAVAVGAAGHGVTMTGVVIGAIEAAAAEVEEEVVAVAVGRRVGRERSQRKKIYLIWGSIWIKR